MAKLTSVHPGLPEMTEDDGFIIERGGGRSQLGLGGIAKDEVAPSRMADAMRWVVYALIEAEERGITQANLDAKLQQAEADPSQAALRRFLGVDGGLGSKLGLPDDFVVQALRATGNYGEIYNRHLGPNSPVAIPRGANRLAGEGGLMIAPPFT